MSKQIVLGISIQNLNEIARYLMISFPYNEEMCSYTDDMLDELYANNYPLVSKGMWSGTIDLHTHTLLNWLPEYGSLYFQAKICDSGTYFLLDKNKQIICKIAGYVPNGLIPEKSDCGDYIRLRIKHDGTIENWPETTDFSDFTEEAEVVKKIETDIKEEPVLDVKVEFTYSQLMSKLLQLPTYLQMEIGKTLISNASKGFDEENQH